MFTSVTSGVIDGISSNIVNVETDVTSGLPGITMVGFTGAHAREAGERVRVALKNAGITIPPSRITVNLSPAGIPKRGTGLDLAIAAGILICLAKIPAAGLKDTIVLGELGLDGSIRPVSGVLPIVRQAAAMGLRTCILPRENLTEGSLINGIRTAGIADLREFMDFVRGSEKQREKIAPKTHVNARKIMSGELTELSADFSDVHGQEGVKRVLEIAAAGFHNVLLIGPPGAGKSMMAACLPGILPAMSYEECMEVTDIYSISGRTSASQPLIIKRPYIAPHHSITMQALAGGGAPPSPGIISLAHRGVLFLDEMPEFGKDVLNVLRQPLESHYIDITRTTGLYRYPSNILLAAAMNPCPCGYYPDKNKCTCTIPEIKRYRHRVPGPILDRIDLCINVPKVPVRTLMIGARGEKSADIRKRVEMARKRQDERFKGTGLRFNSDMDASNVLRICAPDKDAERFLREVAESMQLTARSFHRLLKVSRTIADLDGEERVMPEHIAEAAGYRLRENKEEEI